MELTFASYNIHKAVGMDGRRDPERILAVLHEIGADVVALQEADRRFGRRSCVLPRQAIDDYTPYHPAPLSLTPDGMGWHGNSLLVRRGIEIAGVVPIALPTIEPRGAVCAELVAWGQRIRVAGMHLDLSGLRRRHQLEAVIAHLDGHAVPCPSVMLGDFNEWSRHGGSLRGLGRDWQVVTPGASFPSRRPLAPLDRMVLSPQWRLIEARVHHSPLASRASDHLPIVTRLRLAAGPR